ncbi:MAG TPA: protein kinase, partial [Polyangiaceae bacterium]|nr:protein kinase [Polyangiaceae bacterium]
MKPTAFLSSRVERLDKIHDGKRSVVYRARLRESKRPVIAKVLRGPYPSPEQQSRFRREYEVGRALHGPHIIETIALETGEDTLAILMEDCGAESLAGRGPLELGEFLPLARDIVLGLAHIHACAVAHRDINPSNIVWNRGRKLVKIIDFGISRAVSRESLELDPNVDPHLERGFEGTLAYISPEQTGRINRSVDHRTDLYSLGVTFYELLTGQRPFAGEDAMELIHAQIARVPVAPHERRASVPRPLSDLVMKLLEKNPADRYQSASGVNADLEECSARHARTGHIAGFELARRDTAARLQLPQGLYGRDHEFASLRNALARSAAGRSQIALVSGYSGIGKTRLVRELRGPTAALGGYFVSGKFEQFR